MISGMPPPAVELVEVEAMEVLKVEVHLQGEGTRVWRKFRDSREIGLTGESLWKKPGESSCLVSREQSENSSPMLSKLAYHRLSVLNHVLCVK